MFGQITKKANNIEVRKVKAELDRFALYDDLKQLHDKVIPVLKEYETVQEDFRNEHLVMKEILLSFDVKFDTKANKGEFFKLREEKLDKVEQQRIEDNMN